MAKLTTRQWAGWARALRSGKFKQGKNALKTPEGKYCCLGVLYSVTRIPGIPLLHTAYSGGGMERYENRPVYRFLEATLGEDVVTELMRMNDDGRTFKAIAKRVDALAKEARA